MPAPKKIDQRYNVLKALGDGASGEVLLVSDKDGQKALKFLKKVQLNVSREEALQNFKNEFEILKQLNHPNIARILDFGFDASSQKYYFTSEFVPGALLDKACEGQPMDIVEKLIVQILRALNYLHSCRVYHFDIKPQNILVVMKDGVPVQAKIIDFGLAGYATPLKRVGTPAYMAPEVVRGGHMDSRTDLYSFGVVTYFLLTGTNPFAAKTLKETLGNQVQLTPEPPSAIKPGLPKYWDHIVKRLLEKNPGDRYSQASLVIRDLNFLSNRQIEVETQDTKLSYLPDKGVLIGREKQWSLFTDVFAQAFLAEAPGDKRIFIITGGKGTGKSRLVSEIRYYSQLRNVPMLTLMQLRQRQELPAQFILSIEESELNEDGVNALAQEFSQQRCLIIWPTEHVPQGWAASTVAELGNYTPDELKKYIEAVTGLTSAPIKLITEIYERTQGNPLFVTEFVKSLLGQDLLYDASGKWDAATFDDIVIDFDKLNVPANVEDYLLQQIRPLATEEMRLLTWFAVRNAALNFSQLQRLVGSGTEKDALASRILKLVEKGILKKITDGADYFFNNLPYEGVICGLMSEADLRARHDKLAAIFSDDENNLEAYLYHSGHGSDDARAVDSLTRLSETYFAAKDHAKAAAVLEKLKGRIDAENVVFRRKVMFRLAEAYFDGLQNDKVERILVELRENLGDTTTTSNHWDYLHVQDKLVAVYFRLNLLNKIETIIGECRESLACEPHSTNAMIFKNHEGLLKQKRGEIDEAERIFRQTHEVWLNDFTDDERLQVVNNRLFDVLFFKKEFIETVNVCRQTIAVLEKSGASQHLARLHHMLGEVYYKWNTEERDRSPANAAELCVESFRQCEAIARRLSDYPNMLRAFNGLGNFYLARKNTAEALQNYQRALAIARKSGDLDTAAIIALNISQCFQIEDKWEDTYSYLIYALNTFENNPIKTTHTWLHIALCHEALAEVDMRRKLFDKAHEHLDKIKEIAADKLYLTPYLFGKYFLRLKLYHTEERDVEFLAMHTKLQSLELAASEKAALDEYLESIKEK